MLGLVGHGAHLNLSVLLADYMSSCQYDLCERGAVTPSTLELAKPQNLVCKRAQIEGLGRWNHSEIPFVIRSYNSGHLPP